MNDLLKGKRIAILVTDGFEQIELTEPKKALEKAGAKIDIVSPKNDFVQGWHHQNLADKFSVDVPIEKANPSNYDALQLPGGVINPDQLRMNKQVVEFVKKFNEQDKPIAAICHGPWTLIDADIAKGHKMTSWPSLKTDLNNAGAHWVDESVVIDGKLLTSRKPDDLLAFNEAMVKLFSRG